MKVLILATVLSLALTAVAVGQESEVSETPPHQVAAEAEADAGVPEEAAVDAAAAATETEIATATATAEKPRTVDAYAEVNDIILHLCMECHGDSDPAAGLQLPTTREAQGLAGVPSTQRSELMLIDPGHPETSYFNMKLKGDPGILGRKMPIARLLSDEQLAMFDLWVTELGEPWAEPAEESEGAADVERPEKSADCDNDADQDGDGDHGDDDDSGDQDEGDENGLDDADDGGEGDGDDDPDRD